MELLEFWKYKDRLRFYVSKLICCKCTTNVPLQMGKCTLLEPFIIKYTHYALLCMDLECKLLLMNMKCNLHRFFNYHVTDVET